MTTETAQIEKLFEQFANSAHETAALFEQHFGITGVEDQIFGLGASADQKSHLRNGPAWKTLEALYQYAVNGIEPMLDTDDPFALSDVVLEAATVISLVSSERLGTSHDWEDIIAMGDGRFAVDEGNPVSLSKLALLANVDIRTVRNANSAGDLITFKDELTGEMCAEGPSARAWLYGRRGFKPTIKSSKVVSIEHVNSPSAFGAYLQQQRESHRLGTAPNAALPVEVTKDLESGIFKLPLDMVGAIADFYELDKTKVLMCVMRNFFPEELRILKEGK